MDYLHHHLLFRIMKLELKHLAPYLPYAINCQVKDLAETKTVQLHGVYSDGSCVFHDTVESHKGFSEVKPILRPLSDVNKTLENGKKLSSIASIDFDVKGNLVLGGFGRMKLKNAITLMGYLYRNHFDVYGLIEKGLAIDINSLNPKS